MWCWIFFFFFLNEPFSYVLSFGSEDQTSIITTTQTRSPEKCIFMSLTSLLVGFAFLDKGVIASNRKHKSAKISLTLFERRGNLQWNSCLYMLSTFLHQTGRKKFGWDVWCHILDIQIKQIKCSLSCLRINPSSGTSELCSDAGIQGCSSWLWCPSFPTQQ